MSAPTAITLGYVAEVDGYLAVSEPDKVLQAIGTWIEGLVDREDVSAPSAFELLYEYSKGLTANKLTKAQRDALYNPLTITQGHTDDTAMKGVEVGKASGDADDVMVDMGTATAPTHAAKGSKNKARTTRAAVKAAAVSKTSTPKK